MNKYVHHSRPCLEKSEIDIKPIVLYTGCTLWLPAMRCRTPISRDDLNIEDTEVTGMENDNDGISVQMPLLSWVDWRQKVSLMTFTQQSAQVVSTQTGMKSYTKE